jgi:hypothetical protein
MSMLGADRYAFFSGWGTVAESVARVLEPSMKTLAPALAKLEKSVRTSFGRPKSDIIT